MAVAGDHDEPALGQHAQAPGDALGKHGHVLDAPGLVTFVENLRVQLADQVTYPQPGQLGAMRHRGEEAEAVPGQRLAQLRRDRRTRDREAADHAADYARALAGQVPAGRDGQRLGEVFNRSLGEA